MNVLGCTLVYMMHCTCAQLGAVLLAGLRDAADTTTVHKCYSATEMQSIIIINSAELWKPEFGLFHEGHESLQEIFPSGHRGVLRPLDVTLF